MQHAISWRSRAVVAALIVTAVAAGACGDDASGLLSRHGATSGGTDDGDPSTKGKSGDGGAATGAAANAQALFTALQPDLTKNCGGVCHTDGKNGAPAWMKGPDVYATVKAYPGIIAPNAESSILLTKGNHEGPGLVDPLAGSVKAWLAAEAIALTSSAPLVTADVSIPNGAGSVDLPGPGGKITFTASLTSGILNLSALSVVASGSAGLHITGVHITFVHADNTTSVDDSLGGTDATAPKGQTVALGAGLVIILRVNATDKMHFAFDKLEMSNSTGTDGGTTTGLCKSVTSFQTTAAPAIQAATCLNCHNTGGSGFGSLDLSGLSANPPDYAKACAQAKNKIDTTTPASSSIITAPTGGDASHPLKNASTAYVTSMTTWITAEK